MTIENTMSLIDRQIIETAIDSMIAAGYTIRVNDGEEIVGEFNDKASILAAMFSTGEDYLIPCRANHSCGWVRLIYGNEPGVVISDYTTNLEEVLTAANKLADTI
jgi:hypothetical protein